MTTRRERLEATRDKLEMAIETCESLRDLPALSREYRATLAELSELPTPSEVSKADEIAERRRTRQADPNRKARARHTS